MRWAAPVLAGTAAAVLLAGPVLACGGLIGPNGGVSLERTTTLVAYHNGVEHYVTAFTFSGGAGNFGSITPLPGIPTNVEKGGDWTLQRLVREVTPVHPEALRFAVDAAAAAPAEVLQQVQVGALDITILKGGGGAVGDWARQSGFSLPPDAPQLLDFYASRSQIFMAARFNATRAANQAQGTVTSIHLTIPTTNPWLPLAILTLGKQPTDEIQADAFLLTDRAPAMLPAPVVSGAADQASTNGLTLAASEPASASLITDLRSDQGMSWLPTNGLWLSYLKLDTRAVNLHYDLAMDVSGRNAPSPVAAGQPVGVGVGVAPSPAPYPGGRALWVWAVTGGGAALLAGTWALAYRRSRPSAGTGRPA